MNVTMQAETFIGLVDQNRDAVYRFIRRTLWDAGKADDVFAEGLLSAFENLHRFREGTNFRAWLYRIVLNKCYVANRETGRAPVSLDDVPEAGFEELPRESGYAELLENPGAVLDQCGEEVYRALLGLSERERACILLRGLEAFSYKEIAEILEIPEGTVMTHLSRGRAKLRRDLLEYARVNGIVKSAGPVDEAGKEESA
jgi:RNA polymerase sigma-70 factor, ECF subfamily